jgi:hypothetical protein
VDGGGGVHCDSALEVVLEVQYSRYV